MKATHLVTLIALGLSLNAVPAGAKPKGKRPPPAPEKKETVDVSAIKPFDKDHNWEIDTKEFEALQAAFKANPTGGLKEFDKGGDGVLDPTVDRAAINVKLASAKRTDAGNSGPRRKKK
ncbi:MAG: hypothetical protein K1X78_22175 [Verrucomicrobiaceae bacterium]|nr:hypothetical protein [Verrucomicrobiaceae bacterium]